MGSWNNSSFQSEYELGRKGHHRDGWQRKRGTSVKAMKAQPGGITKDFISNKTWNEERN